MIITIDAWDIVAGACAALFGAVLLAVFLLDKIGCAVRARQQKRIDEAYEEDGE